MRPISQLSVTAKVAVGAAAALVTLSGAAIGASALTGSTTSGTTGTPSVTSTTSGKADTADHPSGTTSTCPTGLKNHGADVSTVAHDRSATGEAHGDAVSTAAKTDCDKPPATKATPSSSTAPKVKAPETEATDPQDKADTPDKADTETTEKPEAPDPADPKTNDTAKGHADTHGPSAKATSHADGGPTHSAGDHS